ncbi:PQ-loop domain-containing transporter [Mesorhizobium sp. LNHC209A00]
MVSASMETVTIVGYLAALCSITSFTPQAWKIIKTRPQPRPHRFAAIAVVKVVLPTNGEVVPDLRQGPKVDQPMK